MHELRLELVEEIVVIDAMKDQGQLPQATTRDDGNGVERGA